MGGGGGSGFGGATGGLEESTRLIADVDTSKPAADRALIYTASLQLSVVTIEPSLDGAQKVATEAGGYMEALTSDSITLRVPAKQFFPVMEKLLALGQVLNKNIQAQDVTDEYVDLQLRLKNAEALRERFEAILAKAQTVKDTLEIERELNRVREEIERIKGKLAVLEKRIAMSTITVSFVKATAAVVENYRPQSPFAWLDRLGVETVLDMRPRPEGGAQ